MTEKRVVVRVPASTANLGPGFDTLGMSLNLYTWVELSIAEQTEIVLYGNELEGLPLDERNLVIQAARRIFIEAGEAAPGFRLRMSSEIPLTRGLGSSASAMIAGMVAANGLLQHPLSDDHLFQLATAWENHPDNVGASLYGGIVVARWDGERAESIRLDPPANLEVLVVIPDFQLETKLARNALPASVPLQDAVFNVSHSSLLVAALATGQCGMIRYAMRDVLHQPYRAALVPGMESLLEGAVSHGALGVALSGAGPTILTLVDAQSTDKARLEAYLQQTLQAAGVAAKTLWLKPTLQGAEYMPLTEQPFDV